MIQSLSLADVSIRYPEFFNHPDIDLAFREADRIGVPIPQLAGLVVADLEARDRNPPRPESSPEEVRKAKARIKAIEKAMKEIKELWKRNREAFQPATFPDPLSPLEKPLSDIYQTLKRERDNLLAVTHPKDPIVERMRRDGAPSFLYPPIRRGKPIDPVLHRLVIKYAVFFRKTTGTEKDNLARLIVGHLTGKEDWIDSSVTDSELTDRYKDARLEIERSEGAKFLEQISRMTLSFSPP
ncbi:MAG: hypothetical protein M0T83_07995 [Nitrospiraceae bacterium]|jgi:hypothetical protein|nr:hypothetical protein [Nitrospiraceae bacterium]